MVADAEYDSPITASRIPKLSLTAAISMAEIYPAPLSGPSLTLMALFVLLHRSIRIALRRYCECEPRSILVRCSLHAGARLCRESRIEQQRSWRAIRSRGLGL